MRSARQQPPILFGILVYLLVAGVASSRVGVNYQESRSGSCRPVGQPARSQSLNRCEAGDDDGGGSEMVMCRPNPKQVASNIAQQAAQDAKKASDTQVPAAVAAARQVKLQLADRAGAAAWAAEAALAGKQEMVEQLKAEFHEAEIVLQDETSSIGVLQNNLNAAVCTADQANELLQRMQDSLKIAQETVASSEAAVCGVHQELQEKNKLVDAAHQRVELLAQQLRNAKMEYENTKKAAYRASCAAAEARQKAMRERRFLDKDIRAYRDQQQEQHHTQEQAQIEQKHHQSLVMPVPSQNINFKQKQPEDWEYSLQNKAKFAG
ncbi:hypothetical protein KR054_009109, partial [Drosophila jambulina]